MSYLPSKNGEHFIDVTQDTTVELTIDEKNDVTSVIDMDTSCTGANLTPLISTLVSLTIEAVKVTDADFWSGIVEVDSLESNLPGHDAIL